MKEVYATENVIDASILNSMMIRNNHSSSWRIIVHITCLTVTLYLCSVAWETIWLYPLILLLGFLLATLFAPFHECTHRTAFKSRRLNLLVCAVTGTLIGFSWSAYRVFHFAHHANTQDPEKDPEILLDPFRLGVWPDTFMTWCSRLSGAGYLRLKLVGFVTCWSPGYLDGFASSSTEARRETRVMSVVWLLVIISSFYLPHVFVPLLGGFVVSHPFLGLWLTAEHTGRPFEGSILERTRTLQTNGILRYFLWNMNYHSEHHGWPGVPWHRLQQFNSAIDGVGQVGNGYVDTYWSAYKRTRKKQLG